MRALFEHTPGNSLPSFADTLCHDEHLARATALAFQTVHDQDLRIVQAPRRLRVFNQVLAEVLLVSAWVAVLA